MAKPKTSLAAPTATPLNPKQDRFCLEYVIDFNATQAAIRAGYSKKTAHAQSWDLLRKPEVQGRIAQLQAKTAQKLEVTSEMVVDELRKIAFSDLRDIVTWGPDGVTMKDSSDLHDDAAAAVAEVSESVTKDGGSKKVKLYDKIAALEKLGKYLGLFTDKLEISGPDGGPIQFANELDRFYGDKKPD